MRAGVKSIEGSHERARLLHSPRAFVDSLDLVNLTPLMERTSGSAEVTVGLVDGPVFLDHRELADAKIQEVPGPFQGTCAPEASAACLHGTFVAGVLCGERGLSAPAICPGCTLLVRPIFDEARSASNVAAATPDDLAAAIVDTVNAGAWVMNISASLVRGSSTGKRAITQALDYAARHGVLTVAAAGNDSTLGGSAIVSHRWVIPVVGCDSRGQPLDGSNLIHSIGRRGLRAPGSGITSLGERGGTRTLSGTSAAAPFVTGAIALMWSESQTTSAADLRFAVTGGYLSRRTLVPPVLDAWSAWKFLESTKRRL